MQRYYKGGRYEIDVKMPRAPNVHFEGTADTDITITNDQVLAAMPEKTLTIIVTRSLSQSYSSIQMYDMNGRQLSSNSYGTGSTVNKWEIKSSSYATWRETMGSTDPSNNFKLSVKYLGSANVEGHFSDTFEWDGESDKTITLSEAGFADLIRCRLTVIHPEGSTCTINARST